MIIERGGNLIVLPAWDEKKVRRSRHFCGRAHASRFVERWIGSPGMAILPDVVGEAESNRVTSFTESEETLAEKFLMSAESGEEFSSARLVEVAAPPAPPPPPASVAPPPMMQTVSIPPACILPPPLTQLGPAAFAREMRMTS